MTTPNRPRLTIDPNEAWQPVVPEWEDPTMEVKDMERLVAERWADAALDTLPTVDDMDPITADSEET